MAPAPCFYVQLLLVFLWCCASKDVYAGDPQGFGIVRAEAFMHGDICSASPVPNKNSLKVTHRYGPCSPLGEQQVPTHHQILLHDIERVAYLQNRVRVANARRNTSMDALRARLEVTLPLRFGQIVESSNYIATIAMGMPPKNQTIEIDTGSCLSWLQCKPCQACHEQRDPIFDPRSSSSFHNVLFHTPACDFLPPHTSNKSGNFCAYHYTYSDNSSTTGLLAMDSLTLAGQLFPSFVFGCGHSNIGLFGKVAGIFGLGRGFHSLVTQTSFRLGNVFSYCLPATTSSTGHLTLGRRQVPSPVYTPMLSGPNYNVYHGLYFIHLLGISVGGHRLPLQATVFQSAHTVIDSGTTISRLPAAAYTELKTTFRDKMQEYELAQPFAIMDTCYNISRREFRYPEITLHFNGTDLLLNTKQVFFVPNPTTYCLAFSAAGSGKVGIIGSVQQRGMEVIYDTRNQKIGFSTKVHC